MKHFLLSLLSALVCLNINAQITSDLDEVEILGTWTVTARAGKFNAAQYPVYNNTRKLPIAFTFNDNKATLVNWQYAANSGWEKYNGYWITHTSDKYVLHLLSGETYDGYSGSSLLNFVIYYYDGETMKLETIDEYGTLTLSKDVSGIESAKAEKAKDGKVYGIDGVQVKNPAHGIFIQDGKKFTAK